MRFSERSILPLMQRHEISADGRRLDILLAASTGLTRSRVAALMADGCCTVDGKEERKAGAKPASGLVVLNEPDPVSPVPQPQNLPLTVLWQDADLAVVIKPCGMVVHPAAGNEDGTLVNALLYHLDQLSGIGGVTRPGVLHRLDKDTSGLLLVAKNDRSHYLLSEALQQHRFDKRYLALAEGEIRQPEGVIDRPIARDPKDRKRMAIVDGGREARTEYRVLAANPRCSLTELHLITGRTHQIRVHLRSIGHPVCGDPIYGAKNGLHVPRLMLHAAFLSFTHPTTGETMRFAAPLPEAFARGLQKSGIDPSAWAAYGLEETC